MTGSAGPARLYFVNWWLDAAAVGGLSIATFAALSFLAHGDGVSPGAAKLVALLTMFVNYPHYAATNYRLYQRREHIRQFPVTALAVPGVIACFAAAALWQPDLVAPYLVSLYLIWSPYHYSGQTVGVTMIYARRCGFRIGRWERLALSSFVFSTFVIAVVGRQPNGSAEFYGIPLLSMIFPAGFGTVMTAAMCLAAATFLGLAGRWCLRQRRVLPLIVLIPALAQFTWFLVARRTGLFFELIPMFHCLQYLFVAWAVQLGSSLDRDGEAASWTAIGTASARWGAINYAGGVALFIALPAALGWAGAAPLLTATGIVIAAINIHHFFVDGVIWKLRDAPDNSPLMVNIPGLMSRRTRSGALATT